MASSNERDQRVQEAFDRIAGEIDVRLDPVPTDDDSGLRTVGVAFACILAKTVAVNTAGGQVLAEMADDDQSEIARLLAGFEALTPEGVAEHRHDFCTDPYVGCGEMGHDAWVATIDQETVDGWLKSPELARMNEDYPHYSPRKVQLDDMHITFIGTTRAAVTYRVTEEHTNGKTTAGNAAAIVINVADAGWRVAICTKGGRNGD